MNINTYINNIFIPLFFPNFAGKSGNKIVRLVVFKAIGALSPKLVSFKYKSITCES